MMFLILNFNTISQCVSYSKKIRVHTVLSNVKLYSKILQLISNVKNDDGAIHKINEQVDVNKKA